jgi:hypothetical protein
MRTLMSLTSVAFAALFATACSEPTTVQPRLRPGGVRNASYTNTKPTLYPNSRKYRDAGFKPAVAHSGAATVQMRALLGVSGTTDL